MDPKDVDLDELPMLSDDEGDGEGQASANLVDLDSLPSLVDDSEPDLVGETQAEIGDIGDVPAGFLDGFLMNYGGELGEIGEGIGNVLPQVSRDENGNIVLKSSPWSADGVNPIEESSKTQLGSLGNLAGNVVGGTALGLATGGVGGVGAQAAIQGGAGAVSGYGANHSLKEAAMGGGLGLLLGGGGRAIAGKVAPAANQLDDVLPRVHAPAGEYAPVMVPGELQSAAGEFTEEAAKPLPPVWSEGPGTLSVEQAAKKTARAQVLGDDEAGWLAKYGGKILDMAGGSPLNSPGRWTAVQGIKKLMADGGQMGTMVRPDVQTVKNIMANVSGANLGIGSRIQARPDVPTLVWALQSVNASGDTSLPPDAQSRLDEALMSGDDSNVSSVYMQLSMAHPGFQKRMQREIESINDEDGT